MKDFFISGIQQVGVGTVDFRRSWNWLIQMFGAETKILEDDTVAERMLPYTGNQPQKRHACIAVNVQGGGGFEIWQYSEREPLNAKFEIGIGEIGIFGTKVKCTDVRAFRKQLLEHWNRCGEVEQLPDGTLCLYVQDLYGNLYQLVDRLHSQTETDRYDQTDRALDHIGAYDHGAGAKSDCLLRTVWREYHRTGTSHRSRTQEDLRRPLLG